MERGKIIEDGGSEGRGGNMAEEEGWEEKR